MGQTIMTDDKNIEDRIAKGIAEGLKVAEKEKQKQKSKEVVQRCLIAILLGFFIVVALYACSDEEPNVYIEKNPLLKSSFWNRVTLQDLSAILDQGKHLHARAKNGRTPLHFAITEDVAPEMVALLLDFGVDINVGNNGGFTPLHYAVGANEMPPGVVALLLERGADVNAQNQFGETPLHYAAGWNDDPEIIKLLLDKGAKVTVQNNYGHTALDYAKENHHLKGSDALMRLKEAHFQ